MTHGPNGQRQLLASLFTAKGVMAWFASALSFLVLDLIWLGIIGRPIYAELMGDLLRPEAYVPAALIFYVFFVTTVYGYGVVGANSPIDALKRGASLGFVTYATYELTNWAVIMAGLRSWCPSTSRGNARPGASGRVQSATGSSRI